MAIFADLPNELQEHIIELVILRENGAPTSIADAATTRKSEPVLENFFDSKVVRQKAEVKSTRFIVPIALCSPSPVR
jgi:hypothetical protein